MGQLRTMMDDALQRLGVAGEDGFVIAALYKFVDLPDYRDWQPVLQALCEAGGVRGTLLLADEGINGTICARRDGMGRVLDWIEAEPRLDGLSLKFSAAPDQAFLRMKVRLKREIVTMGRPEISPARSTGIYVDPHDWNSLVDDPDVMVIDTRNAYETAIGTFDGAVDPQTDSFREFPEWAAQLAADPDRPKKLAMFCTGGIRCEKASALMQDMGFDEVYHLKGGILKYLEDVPQADSRWQGECFVFDERVARQIMRLNIGLQIIQLPIGKRVDLETTVAVLLDNVHFLTRARLKAFTPGNQRVNPPNGTRLRQHFANMTAPVRVAPPQIAFGVAFFQIIGMRANGAYIRQPQQGLQSVTIAQGFAEQFAGVQKDDRCCRID